MRSTNRLTPGAPLVVNAQPPPEAVEVPETLFGSVRVGRSVYQGSGSAHPDGPGTVIWRMRYRVLDESERLVRETVAAYRWHVIAPATLLSELSAAGFDAELGPLDVVIAVVAAPAGPAAS